MRTQSAEPVSTVPDAPTLARSRPRYWLAEALATLLIVAYGLLVPEGSKVEVDHLGALQTLAAMRKGKASASCVPATPVPQPRHQVGRPRSYCTPYIFLLWREVPPHLLYAAFLVAVVGVTTFFLMRCT